MNNPGNAEELEDEIYNEGYQQGWTDAFTALKESLSKAETEFYAQFDEETELNG